MSTLDPVLVRPHPEVGEHGLLAFGRPEARRDALRAFIAEGLAANERVLVVAFPDSAESFRASFSDLEGFEPAVVRGQLLVFPGAAFHESLGVPSPEGLEALHGHLVQEAMREGYAGVRAAVDVTYYLDAPDDAAIERFEGAIGARFPFHFRLLCLLDASTPRGAAVASRLARLHTPGRVDAPRAPL